MKSKKTIRVLTVLVFLCTWSILHVSIIFLKPFDYIKNYCLKIPPAFPISQFIHREQSHYKSECRYKIITDLYCVKRCTEFKVLPLYTILRTDNTKFLIFVFFTWQSGKHITKLFIITNQSDLKKSVHIHGRVFVN